MLIKNAKLRGVESNGMICSSTELGLAKLNDGILVLDDSIGELVLGKELREYSKLNDSVIEIGLTPNRGDCLSINGIARELSAYYNIPLNDLEKQVNYNDEIPFIRTLFKNGKHYEYQLMRRDELLFINKRNNIILEYYECDF